ncbi:hypothetical protein QEZ47_02400 [Aminobacter anthyllidis]|uniref:hypothetical protein n=1 Tax=Aminobacter anthyllidis TaxID=1035067 RepID=UPI002453E6BD|nr:hypothetical protein [Aminobacter anthyllidis]MDH4984429.1 hypothetical protein [Aminobacter anthyllidis]
MRYLEDRPSPKSPQLCVMIFDGRTGSSELVARLNSHPNVLFYPEILAGPANPDHDYSLRWTAIDKTISDVAEMSPVSADLASYQKTKFDPEDIKICGLKTRLHGPDDGEFFEREGKAGNFYVVEGDRLLKTLTRHRTLLIRLRRRDIKRTAISWHRAVELNNQKNLWNVTQSHTPIGPITIDPDSFRKTANWVRSCQLKHDAAFSAYRGKKISIDYEDMLDDWPGVQAAILEFLGLPQKELTEFYKKATPDDLSEAVVNLDEIERVSMKTLFAS